MSAKRTAILVIAAVNQAVYRHYIATYWTELIRHTNESCPDVDVFLLIENGMDRAPFEHLRDNVIEDPVGDFDDLVPARFRRIIVPGILHKTIHALDVLQGHYDVFFRTNLSSMIKFESFRSHIAATDDVGYSGAWVWDDALRADLVHWNWVGPDKSIADLSELDDYPGNTFISGSGYFLGSAEAALLVEQRDRIRWDIADDVAVGLMIDHHTMLPGFATVVTADKPIPEMVEKIRTTSATHIRLQHLPVEIAQALWTELAPDPLLR